MTQFDLITIGDSFIEIINSYDGPASALLFDAYRDGISVSAVNGTVGFDGPTSATTNNTFEISSQTKMMTTAALLQLVGEGHFSLDDRLANAMGTTLLS